MGDKYPEWWPTSMTGAYGGSSGGFNKRVMPKKHSQEGQTYNEKYKPQIRDTSKSNAFSYLDKPTISERAGGANVNKWRVENQPLQREKCPRCGGTMVKRNGKFGMFLGCSNYPKCKYTRN